MVVVSVELSDGLHRWCEEAAAASGKSIPAVIEDAVQLYRDTCSRFVPAAPPVALPSPSSASSTEQEQIEEAIRLISALEHRLEFVGFGYLIGKPMDKRRLFPASPDRRRALILTMADQKLLEVYKVDNADPQGDLVTAVRLLQHATVTRVLAEG